jgi:stearoyl-CoA desaturase (delta-9 desaturase)
MQLVAGSERIISNASSSPVDGSVHWAPVKSLWIGSMSLTALLLGPLYFTCDALLLFLFASGVTLCAGHSVGMHRRLIHSSFACPMWLEYVCVYLGVLVGMAGPIGMIQLHDMRDWAQRQPACHDYFAHRGSFWRDGWDQLHRRLELSKAPEFRLETRLAHDRFYLWLERTWMAQQLPWALLFFGIGGMPWLVWGICVRVAVCVTGHWLVGHYVHREGGQTWVVEGACVQGFDVKVAGFISMGESWHNNHHAFPASAKLGLRTGQVDLGWMLILLFRRLHLAWDIITPERLPHRPALSPVADHPLGCPLPAQLLSRRTP